MPVNSQGIFMLFQMFLLNLNWIKKVILSDSIHIDIKYENSSIFQYNTGTKTIAGTIF